MLTDSQEDALKEIGNIGMSKAAKQLSNMLKEPIQISIPQITLLDMDNLELLQKIYQDEIYSLIYQSLSVELEGYAALALKREQTYNLTSPMLGKIPALTDDEVRQCEQDALLEIGNIIISSCVTIIINFLSKDVELSLPYYQEDTMHKLLHDLCQKVSKVPRKVLVISTSLNSSSDRMSGCLFLVLTEASVNKMIESITRLINGQDVG